MIITTSQDLAAVGCCGCDTPECDVPRKECESISLYFSCYFDMGLWAGTSPDIPPEDMCMRFGKIQTLRIDEDHREDLDGYSYDEVISIAEEAKMLIIGDDCIETLVKSDYDRLQENHDVSPSWDRVWHDYWYFDETTACDGRTIYTDSLDTASNYNKPLGCPSLPTDYRVLVGNNSLWTYVSPGVFKYHYFNDDTDPLYQVTDTYETTITVSFLDPFDAAYAATKLAELSYPDDVDGSQCSAEIVSGEGCPDNAISARKARYRFGPPDGYTRSTWEMQWDEVFASDDWWAWFDGGSTGTEPAPGPSLVASKSWTWDGSEEWSDWYEIPIPTEPGETRVVNVLTKCYKSTRLGVAPTLSGPSVTLPP